MRVQTWSVIKKLILTMLISLLCNRCPLCGVEEESVSHLFFEYRVS